MDEMNDQDRQRIDNLEQKIDSFIASLDIHFKRWDAIYWAIKGNEFDAESGLSKQMGDLRKKIIDLELRVEKNEQSNFRILAFSSVIAVVISTLFSAGKLFFSLWAR
jgi:hypothetical protein